MTLITLLVALVIMAVALRLLRSRMDGTLYSVILVVIILAVCFVLFKMLGIFSGGPPLK